MGRGVDLGAHEAVRRARVDAAPSFSGDPAQRVRHCDMRLYCYKPRVHRHGERTTVEQHVAARRVDTFADVYINGKSISERCPTTDSAHR